LKNNPQPGLFGKELPPAADQRAETSAATLEKQGISNARGIGPTTPTEEIMAIAASLPAGVHLGTSSWSFPGWNGIVYDGEYREARLARNGLRAYATHPLFATVGIDRTFYGPISQPDFAAYAAQVPAHFRFLVKAPMAVTSPYLRNDAGTFTGSAYFLDPAYAIDEFVAPCLAGLGEKAGQLVFQFPPQGAATARRPDPFINRLYRFLKALPALPAGTNYAVEVRDRELLTDRFFKCLQAAGSRFCIASHARMPSPGEQLLLASAVDNPGPLVARWSLHAGFKYEDAKSRYFPFNRIVDEDLDSRESLAEACVATLAKGFPVYVVVNNKAEGSAPLSVVRLAQRLVQLRLKMPPAYPNSGG
jgi:uncharacterized protein YecE (DUF72 family)